MATPSSSKTSRLITLVKGAFTPPPGVKRVAIAYLYGAICHVIFTLAVVAMFLGLFYGMSRSFGAVPAPWAWVANVALILQFPLLHSVLLTRRGGAILGWFAPGQHALTLSTTTYAIVASMQLLALFALWTPSGVIWWEAEGAAFGLLCTLYLASWGLLMKASFDAGAEVQSGALGWMSLAKNVRPIFPDMPTTGAFRIIRQPIYVAFALTLWTVPVWTPDQLVLAVSLTAYCLLAPLLKERRFAERYGAAFAIYRGKVPYAVPRWRGRK